MRGMLMIDDAEGAVGPKKMWPNCHAPQMFCAFDFERNRKILKKCAPFLSWKTKQLRISQKELVIRVISGIPEIEPRYKTSLNASDEFMTSFLLELSDPPSPESLYFVVVKPGKDSRVKIYIRPFKTSFNSAKNFYTLGVLPKDDITLKGVNLLRTFYEVVLDIKDGEEDKELTVYHPGWGSVLFNCFFKPDCVLPIPQSYITVWKFLPDDKTIIQRLIMFWKRIGWQQQAEKYA